ncbi:hypothetical protein BGX27_002518, partial [Mortierella sp. AM989]
IPEIPRMESTLKTSLFRYAKGCLTIHHDLPRVLQKDLFGETGLEGSGEARIRNEAEYVVQKLKGRRRVGRRSLLGKSTASSLSVERMKKWELCTISNNEMKALGSFADE